MEINKYDVMLAIITILLICLFAFIGFVIQDLNLP